MSASRRWTTWLTAVVGGLAAHAAGPAAADPTVAAPVSDIPSVRPQSSDTRVTLAAVGDIVFGRYLHSPDKYRRVSATEQPFSLVASVLRRVDVAFANVESPVMTEPASFGVFRALTFRANPADAHTLANAGFDAVSIANNHTLNLGPEGAAATRANILAAGLVSAGAGRTENQAVEPAILEVNGARIALLCYTVWTNGRDPVEQYGAVAHMRNRDLRHQMPEVVRSVRKRYRPDFVVVSLHWGFEYDAHPREFQKRAAHAIVDAGADVILGHHPHVVQDIERYRGGVIAYSLGNFLFDNPTQQQRRTIIFEATLEASQTHRRVVDITLHPVIIRRNRARKTSTPAFATGTAYRRWARELSRLAPGVTIAREPTAIRN